MGGIQGWHIVILVVLVLLLFGAPKLPQLAKSMGQSMRIFKSEVKTMRDESSEKSSAEENEDPDSGQGRTVQGRVLGANEYRDHRDETSDAPSAESERRGDRG